MKKFWLIVILIIFCIGAGVVIARTYWPKVIQPPPKIEYVDREITKRDTVTVVRPEIRTIYRTVTELRTDTVFVPVGFNSVGVISPSPIRFKGGNVILTYFGLADTAFVQDKFRIPRPTTAYYVSTVTGINPFTRNLNLGFEWGLRYRRFTLYGRATTPDNLTVGIRFRFYGVE